MLYRRWSRTELAVSLWPPPSYRLPEIRTTSIIRSGRRSAWVRGEYVSRLRRRYTNTSATFLPGVRGHPVGVGGWIRRQRSPPPWPTFRPSSSNKGREKGLRCMRPHRTICVPNCFTALQGTTSKLLSVSRCTETVARNVYWLREDISSAVDVGHKVQSSPRSPKRIPRSVSGSLCLSPSLSLCLCVRPSNDDNPFGVSSQSEWVFRSSSDPINHRMTPPILQWHS